MLTKEEVLEKVNQEAPKNIFTPQQVIDHYKNQLKESIDKVDLNKYSQKTYPKNLNPFKGWIHLYDFTVKTPSVLELIDNAAKDALGYQDKAQTLTFKDINTSLLLSNFDFFAFEEQAKQDFEYSFNDVRQTTLQRIDTVTYRTKHGHSSENIEDELEEQLIKYLNTKLPQDCPYRISYSAVFDGNPQVTIIG